LLTCENDNIIDEKSAAYILVLRVDDGRKVTFVH